MSKQNAILSLYVLLTGTGYCRNVYLNQKDKGIISVFIILQTSDIQRRRESPKRTTRPEVLMKLAPTMVAKPALETNPLCQVVFNLIEYMV